MIPHRAMLQNRLSVVLVVVVVVAVLFLERQIHQLNYSLRRIGKCVYLCDQHFKCTAPLRSVDITSRPCLVVARQQPWAVGLCFTIRPHKSLDPQHYP